MKTPTIDGSPAKLAPVLFSFFVMGFVDVVGISTSYVKQDFGLNDTLANLLPMMVFVWFAVCSLPTGILMERIGRKRMVLFSAWVTCVGMCLPLLSYSFPWVLAAFALLGVGNTILQVSLNPLLLEVVSKGKVTGMLTLGQFIKAVSSTLGPILVGMAAGIGGNWRLIFPLYAALTFLSWVWLACTPVREAPVHESPCGESPEEAWTERGGRIRQWVKQPKLALAFLAILLIVGFEIGLMTAVPKYLLERCRLPIAEGGLGCSLYFAARTLGTLLGSIVLVRYSARYFLIGNMFLALAAFALFMVAADLTVLLTALFLIGLFCANVFPVVFSFALQSAPEKANAISALMIMGVAGGAVLPLVMGIVADAGNQRASLWVPLAALLYITYVAVKLK